MTVISEKNEQTRRRGALGSLELALLRLFAREATVAAVHALGGCYYLITLSGEPLRGVIWSPGQKMQVQLGGFISRTYTPIEWDGEAGVTRLLGFAHGRGPGAKWVQSVRRGDRCVIQGPNRSLVLDDLSRPLLVFGDETSIGLAHALFRSNPEESLRVHLVLEVSNVTETQAVLEALALPRATLIERLPFDRHLEQAESVVRSYAAQHPTASYVLIGNSISIQRLGRALKAQEVPAVRIKSKVYWAPGRSGLD